MQRTEVVVPQPESHRQIRLNLPGVLTEKAVGRNAEILAEIGRDAGRWVIGSGTGPREESNAALIVGGVVGKVPQIIEVILRPRVSCAHVGALLFRDLAAKLQYV